MVKPYRGTGRAPHLLLLVSARGGNIPTQLWIDDRRFAITALYPSSIIRRADTRAFPLLPRRPGFHTGEHFLRVEQPADGMSRQYRVLFIDGVLAVLSAATRMLVTYADAVDLGSRT